MLLKVVGLLLLLMAVAVYMVIFQGGLENPFHLLMVGLCLVIT